MKVKIKKNRERKGKRLKKLVDEHYHPFADDFSRHVFQARPLLFLRFFHTNFSVKMKHFSAVKGSKLYCGKNVARMKRARVILATLYPQLHSNFVKCSRDCE